MTPANSPCAFETTGAVLAGPDGFDSAIGDSRPYGGAWQGPVLALTHHPEDARGSEGRHHSQLPRGRGGANCAEAAGCRNLEVFSPTIGRQLLDLGLIDEIDLRIAPILLGAGIRLYDNPGAEPHDRLG